VKRADLEHIIRAAAEISNDPEMIVIGSQAILGSFPEAPADLLVSMDADLYPKNHPERADLIDGSIGEGSPFHDAFGYYVHGVDERTAILPRGWQNRLVRVQNENTRGNTGWCLDPHDLTVAKTVAGREKDLTFLATAVRHGLVERETLLARVEETTMAAAVRSAVIARMHRAFASLSA
jgi:hypothetical protein